MTNLELSVRQHCCNHAGALLLYIVGVNSGILLCCLPFSDVISRAGVAIQSDVKGIDRGCITSAIV